MNSSRRSFEFTINPYRDIDIAGIILMSDYCKYLIVSFEKFQLKGYVYFGDRKQSLNGVKRKWLQRATIKIGRSCNDYDELDYKKFSDCYEVGDKPAQGRISNARINEIMNDPSLFSGLNETLKIVVDKMIYEKHYIDFYEKMCNDNINLIAQIMKEISKKLLNDHINKLK